MATIIPIQVVYCGRCSLPAEYCEFNTAVTDKSGKLFAECKEWLIKNHEDLYNRLYGSPDTDDLAKELDKKAAVSTASDTTTTADDSNEQTPAASAPPKGKKGQKQPQPIQIKRVDRNKRKTTTTIENIQLYPSIDMKKLAKSIANKFACGASVSKNASGQEEIVVQGDVGMDVVPLILAAGGGQVSESQCVFVDGSKKSKKSAEEQQ
jgi:density-regulated protein DRP1